MIRQPIGKRRQVILGVVCICLVVLLYACLSYRQHRKNPKDTTVPNLSQFVEGWKRMLTPQPAGETWSLKDAWPPKSRVWLIEDFWATYSRLFAGMLVGVFLAFVVGMSMGCFAQAESFFLPTLNFFAKIPPTAMMAVYFILFGMEFRMYVAMIGLGIAPTLAQTIHQAAKKDVTDHAVFKAYTLGASHMETIWNVVCRQILPRVIESVRLQVGLAMIFLIAAEMLTADVGFGYRLRLESRLLNMNVVYSYLIILGATGLLIDWSLSSLRRKLCPWFGE
ncbi:ABC transporter permease [Planctomycetota bacterium]